MDFKIELAGLDDFLVNVNTKKLSKQVAVGIGNASNILEAKIQEIIVRKYNISSKEIKKLKLNKSISLQKTGKNIITKGFGYKYKLKPLQEYPFKLFEVSAKNRFLIPRETKNFSLIKRNTAQGVKVAVKRGKYKVVTGKYGQGGFYQKKSSTSKWAQIQGGKSKSRPEGIYERTSKNTWIQEPFIRAPIRRAIGPSVTELIENILDKDSSLLKIIDRFDELILKEIKL